MAYLNPAKFIVRNRDQPDRQLMRADYVVLRRRAVRRLPVCALLIVGEIILGLFTIALLPLVTLLLRRIIPDGVALAGGAALSLLAVIWLFRWSERRQRERDMFAEWNYLLDEIRYCSEWIRQIDRQEKRAIR